METKTSICVTLSNRCSKLLAKTIWLRPDHDLGVSVRRRPCQKWQSLNIKLTAAGTKDVCPFSHGTLRTFSNSWAQRRVCGGCGAEEEGVGSGNRTSIFLPKTLSCISGSCLEACQRAKRLELRGRLTAAQRTLRHLTIGTVIQTTHAHKHTHAQWLRSTCTRTHAPTRVYA